MVDGGFVGDGESATDRHAVGKQGVGGNGAHQRSRNRELAQPVREQVDVLLLLKADASIDKQVSDLRR